MKLSEDVQKIVAKRRTQFLHSSNPDIVLSVVLDPEEFAAEIEAAVTRRVSQRCIELAKAEGAVGRADGGNLSRWDSCDNVAKVIRSAYPLSEEEK